MLCKSCHYPLKQLSEPRCPECGREFDPDNPNTYLITLDPPRRRWLKALVFALSGYVALFAWLFVARLRGPFPQRMSERFVRALTDALLMYGVVLAAFLLFLGMIWIATLFARRLLEASSWSNDE